MRQAHRLLNIHAPVDMSDDRFGHIADDPTAAGRANGQNRDAVFQHNRRSHGGPGPFARCQCIGNGHPIPMGPKAEIRQLVVEQKSMHHQPRAKGVFDGRRHRGHIAISIHDRDMRGRWQLQTFVIDPVHRMVKSRVAGSHLFQCGLAVQHRRAVGKIGPIHQPLGRHRHKIAVCHEPAPIRKGKARGITDQPPAFGALWSEGRQIVVVQHAQDLPNGQRTGRRRAHATDIMLAVKHANGCTGFDPIGRHVPLGQHARIVIEVVHRRFDILRDAPVIKHVRPLFGQDAQHIGIVCVDQCRAFGDGCAPGQEVLGR
mmetsp:Transcript_22831/g.38032  ORF Transcript_22831/g.38032 Transcript_22831/m.38032 type:complete len:315 (-) Transcript_22831:1759-2703(-)